MKREVISKNQMQLLIFSYPIGSYLLFTMGSEVGQDAWIASIIGIVISIPILMLYGRLMNLYPGKNIFDILKIVFGKIFGGILSILFVFHLIFVGAYILNDFIDFIKLTALWNTPIFIPILCIGVLSIWILKEGIEVLSNWTKLNIRFVLIFIALSGLLLLPQMDISNLQPIFYHDFKEIFKTSISLSTFPFGELFIFISLFDCIDTQNTNIKNIFIKPLIISGLLATIIMMANLMLLGSAEYSYFYYSGYEAMKKMHLRGQYQRLEIIVSMIYTIIQFLQINYCILGASKGVQKVFNLKDYRYILVPVVFLVMNFSYIMFGSVMDSINFSQNSWPFYGILVQVIFPIIISIVALIRKKLSKI